MVIINSNFAVEFILVFILCALTQVSAQTSFTDLSFGENGKVAIGLTDDATGNGGFQAIFTDDGKILQFGSTANAPNISSAAIVKLKENGKLDEEFGNGGIVVNHYPNMEFTRFYTGAVYEDGRIIAVGSASGKGLNYALIARFLPDGNTDPSFGTNGKGFITTRLDGVQINYFWSGISIAEQTGKITVAGTLDYQIAIASFDDDGSLDVSFGTYGIRVIPVTILGEIWELKPARGGFIIAGKTETNLSDANYSDYIIVKIKSDGDLDYSFADHGIKRFDLTPDTESDAEIIYALEILADEGIVAVGRTGDSFPKGVLIKLRSNGNFDSSFGENGFVIIDYAANFVPADLAVQPSGKVVITGTSERNFLTMRRLPDGKPDFDFGTGSVISTDFGGNDHPFSIALKSNKILTAGYGFGTGGIPRKFVLARYMQNIRATGEISGKLTNLAGRGIPDGEIEIIRVSDNTLQAKVITKYDGTFSVPDALIGQTYQVKARAQRCLFSQSEVTVNLERNETINFRANCFRLIKPKNF